MCLCVFVLLPLNRVCPEGCVGNHLWVTNSATAQAYKTLSTGIQLDVLCVCVLVYMRVSACECIYAVNHLKARWTWGDMTS